MSNYIELDETHDATVRSWVGAANAPLADFPVQNLPFGRYVAGTSAQRIGVAIGSEILDLGLAFDAGLLTEVRDCEAACRASTLRDLMLLGRPVVRRLRKALFRLLSEGSPHQDAASGARVPMGDVTLMLPTEIGDFTDFYTSIHHARRGAQLSRPGSPPLLPNFRHLPVAYHGRASSVVASGRGCVRPKGQLGAVTEAHSCPRYEPTRKLDFELEVGFYVGSDNELGDTTSVDAAEDRIFGLCLVNDWSARDIQRWESQPLGPFLAKSFMTSASPWVVTLDALAPFRVSAADRGADAPPLAEHLDSARNRAVGGIDIALSVMLHSQSMRDQSAGPAAISNALFRLQYWNVFQMLAHHGSNGCNLRSGDLLASGTVSDADQHRAGCMFELALDGTDPLELPGGETRDYLADGDDIIFKGRCSREGFRSIGFGDCMGRVLPARPGA